MGIHVDGLDDHEGYAAHQLPDGTLAATSTASFDAYLAACSCGWTGSSHPPDEHGREHAEAAWEIDHARPLLATVVPPRTRRTLDDARHTILELAQQRPDAALRALDELSDWARRTAEQTRRRTATEHLAPGGAPAIYREQRRRRRGRGLSR